jgi:hypothetical protein
MRTDQDDQGDFGDNRPADWLWLQHWQAKHWQAIFITCLFPHRRVIWASDCHGCLAALQGQLLDGVRVQLWFP